jgi:anti-sigma factor RsiW
VTCERALEVQAYADGELDAVSALAVEQHLETCAECRALHDGIVEMRAALKRDARYYRPAEAFTQRIRSDIARESSATRRRATLGSRPFWTGAFGGVAATALAASLVLFVMLPSAQDQLANDVASAHVRSLIGDHLIDVASSNHHVVKPWFAGRADISPPVADYAAQGFTLVGGRLDYVDGKRAAVLVYRHGAHIVNVFSWKDDGSLSARTKDVSGYHLLAWRDGGLFFCAVSDMDSAELRTLSDLMRKNMSG